MPGKIYPPPVFLQSDLGHRADSRWALPHISSLYYALLRLLILVSWHIACYVAEFELCMCIFSVFSTCKYCKQICEYLYGRLLLIHRC